MRETHGKEVAPEKEGKREEAAVWHQKMFVIYSSSVLG
jgi:hypothetical protein